MKHYEVRTASGSVYRVSGDGTKFQCWKPIKQVNTNDYSNVAIERDFELAQVQPWPPVVGQRMIMLTAHFLEPEHDQRMPGGGKITSQVVDVREVVEA